MPKRGITEDSETSRLAALRNPRHPFWIGLAVFVGYTALAFFVFHTAWRAPSTRLIGTCCDQPPTVNFLAWTGFALTHGHNPFIVHYLNAPQGINLMWQPDGMPLLGAVATPFEWLLGPVVTYNLLVTLALSLSGWAAYVALRRWIGGYAGPIIGGLFYGFSPFMTTHALGHLNIMFVPIPPLLLLAITDLLVYRRHKWWLSGMFIGLLGTAQFLIGQEILVGTIIVSAITTVVILICHWKRVLVRWPSVVGGGLVGLGTMVVTSAWPLIVLVFGPYRLSGTFEPTPFSTDVLNLIIPGYASQFRPDGAQYFTQWGWFLGEASSYIGIVLLVISVAVVARRWRQTPVKAAAIVGSVMLVLSMGPTLRVAGINLHIWLPSALLIKLPMLQNLLPSRLMVFVDLSVAVLLAEFVRRSLVVIPELARRTRYVVRVGWVAVLVLALVPLAPTFHYFTTEYPQPAFFQTSDVTVIPSGSRVLVAPYPQGGPNDGAPMIWQAQANFQFAMVGGYVFAPLPHGAPGAMYGGDPTVLTTRLSHMANNISVAPLTPALVVVMQKNLASFDLSAVIVGPMPNEAQALTTMAAVIGRAPIQQGGIYLWNGHV